MAATLLEYFREMSVAAHTPLAAKTLKYAMKMVEENAELCQVVDSFVENVKGAPDTFGKYLLLMQHKVIQKDFDDAILMASAEVDSAWQFHLLNPVSYFAMCKRLAPSRVINRRPVQAFSEAMYANTRMLFFLVYKNPDLCLDTRSADPAYLTPKAGANHNAVDLLAAVAATASTTPPTVVSTRTRQTIVVHDGTCRCRVTYHPGMTMADVYRFASIRFNLNVCDFVLTSKGTVVGEKDVLEFSPALLYLNFHVLKRT